jgi:Flp pilus assembly pilin Flp
MRAFKALITGESGQDIAEYCLLTALVALIALGIFVHLSGGMAAIWGGANTSLVAGNSAVSPPASGTAVTTSAPGK